jgi:hypothetical protein
VFRLLESLDTVGVLVSGGALATFAYQLAKGLGQALLEWTRGQAEVAKIQATGKALVAEIQATSEADTAKVRASTEAKIAEMCVAHELQPTLERGRPDRPRQVEPRPMDDTVVNTGRIKPRDTRVDAGRPTGVRPAS